MPYHGPSAGNGFAHHHLSGFINQIQFYINVIIQYVTGSSNKQGTAQQHQKTGGDKMRDVLVIREAPGGQQLGEQ